MAAQPSKSGNRVALVVGLLCAALAFGGVLFIARQTQGGGTGAPTRQVVVAKSDLDAGSTLTADSVKLADVGGDGVPSDAFTDPNAVAGRILIGHVSANTPIVPGLLSQVPGAQAASSGGSSGTATTAAVQPPLAVSKGHVAMAIPASGAPGAPDYAGDLFSVGYYIQAGDHIDILVDPGNGPPGVRYSFQDVLVLRAGAAGAAAGAVPAVYVVELPRQQAEQLTFLITHRGPQSVVKYVLRPREEYGKPGSPNYEDSTVTPIPPKQDATVTAPSITGLFPR